MMKLAVLLGLIFSPEVAPFVTVPDWDDEDYDLISTGHDASKCREYDMDSWDEDCCGSDYETFCADNYTMVRGEGEEEECWPGTKGYLCVPGLYVSCRSCQMGCGGYCPENCSEENCNDSCWGYTKCSCDCYGEDAYLFEGVSNGNPDNSCQEDFPNSGFDEYDSCCMGVEVEDGLCCEEAETENGCCEVTSEECLNDDHTTIIDGVTYGICDDDGATFWGDTPCVRD